VKVTGVSARPVDLERVGGRELSIAFVAFLAMSFLVRNWRGCASAFGRQPAISQQLKRFGNLG
jgi:hypothetical protein